MLATATPSARPHRCISRFICILKCIKWLQVCSIACVDKKIQGVTWFLSILFFSVLAWRTRHRGTFPGNQFSVLCITPKMRLHVLRRMSIGLRSWPWWTCLGMLLSCLGHADSRPGTSQPRSLTAPRGFDVKGVVRGVNGGERSVTITHEAIPDFMAAMTMPFHVKSTNELAGRQ